MRIRVYDGTVGGPSGVVWCEKTVSQAKEGVSADLIHSVSLGFCVFLGFVVPDELFAVEVYVLIFLRS
jgi:hypothetical protein